VAARERILDAATALMERSGFDAVNVVAVAAEAGVSRQTVYTHFGSREELLSQALARISAQVLERIDALVADQKDAGEYVVEFLVAVRSEFRSQPLLRSLWFTDRGSPLFDENLFARGTPVSMQILEPPLLKREPRLAERFDDVVELLMRVGLSILLFDSDAVRTDDDLRTFLRWSLIPPMFANLGDT
jgi:AcrR family transcriptional regulator